MLGDIQLLLDTNLSDRCHHQRSYHQGEGAGDIPQPSQVPPLFCITSHHITAASSTTQAIQY